MGSLDQWDSPWSQAGPPLFNYREETLGFPRGFSLYVPEEFT